jgi:hypothetical protein
MPVPSYNSTEVLPQHTARALLAVLPCYVNLVISREHDSNQQPVVKNWMSRET